MGVISFIGSGMFILGSAMKSAKSMRIAMLIGASIFCVVFFASGLDNPVNLSNFMLNAVNVVLHTWHLTAGLRKRNKAIKNSLLVDKAMARVA